MRFSTVSRCVVGACCALFVALPAAAQTPAPFFTHGVACAEPTSTDAVLWTRTASAAAVTPELLDHGGAVRRALPAACPPSHTPSLAQPLPPRLPARPAPPLPPR